MKAHKENVKGKKGASRISEDVISRSLRSSNDASGSIRVQEDILQENREFHRALLHEFQTLSTTHHVPQSRTESPRRYEPESKTFTLHLRNGTNT